MEMFEWRKLNAVYSFVMWKALQAKFVSRGNIQ